MGDCDGSGDEPLVFSAVENKNHLPRNVSMNEHASRAWANHAPSNNAILNNALAIIRPTFPEANMPTAHPTFQMNPDMRLNVICSVAPPLLHQPLKHPPPQADRATFKMPQSDTASRKHFPCRISGKHTLHFTQPAPKPLQIASATQSTPSTERPNRPAIRTMQCAWRTMSVRRRRRPE